MAARKSWLLPEPDFAHHPQAFAFPDVEADIADGMDITFLGGEMHIEIADFQQCHFIDPPLPVFRIEGRRAARRR